MKKNGDYNNIEKILQKRYEGVKKDIKDPGFVNINYAGAQRKERFFEKPAVYAAGLVLVAVLVCGGTFIGLKYLEKLGASRIDPLTSDTVGISGELTDPDVTDTEQVTDDDCGTDKLRAPVYMTVKSGGETIYPNADFLWSEKYSDGDGAWIDADGAGAETVKAVPDIAFDGVSLEIGYENASEVHYSIKQNEKPVYSGDGDLSGFFSEAEQGVYRVIASFTVTGREIDGKFESSAWECPFDVAVWTTEVTVMETEPDSDNVSETETETDTETETTAETTDITLPGTYKEGKPPVYLKVFDANEIIYPDAWLWGTEVAKNVPVLHYDGSDIDIAYVQPSGRCYVGYRRYGSDEEEHISVDYINDYLKHAHTGTYRFVIRFSFTYGDTVEGFDYPFDVEVLIKEETTEPEETTGPDLHDPETPDLTVKVTCGAKTIIPDAYAAYGGGGDEDNAYMSNKVPYITYVNDGMKADYDERNIANVSYWIAFSDKKSWTLEEVNDYLKDAVEGEYRIVIRIKRETHDEYGNFINSTYDYPFDVIVTTPAEPIEPDMTNGKHPVYLTVKCGNQTVYPDAYFLWTTEYRDEEGGWLEGDGAGAVWAENVPVIEFDGGAAIKIGYKEAGNGTSLSFRINKGEEYWNVSRDEINSFFKHAELGTYRITVTCSVKGRLIDGQYESTGWEYPFDVKIQSAETETYPTQEFIDLIEVRANGEKINGLIPEWETFTGYELEIVGREDILIYYKTGMTVSAINKASVVEIESTVRVQGGYNDTVSHNSLDSLNNAITKALQDGADSIYITVDMKNSNAYAHYSFEIMFGQKGKAPVYLSVAGDGRIYPDAYPDHVDVYENGKTVKTTGNGVSDAKNIPTVNYGEGLSVNYNALTDKYLPQRLIKYELYDINTGAVLTEGPTINRLNAYLESAKSGIYRAVVSFYLNDFNMNDGTTVTGYYVYPFNVYVEYKETSDAKRPVYLTVSNGNGTIYPDGYFCWCEMYDDRSGSWVDGCNGLAPSYVAVIKYDGGDLVFRYDDAGNGTEIDGIGCYDENENPCYPSVGTFDDLNRFFKTADNGVYRVYVSFIIKGRLIDGKYERECWEYPFDVVVK